MGMGAARLKATMEKSAAKRAVVFILIIIVVMGIVEFLRVEMVG